MMQLLPIFLFADLETTQDRPIFFWRPIFEGLFGKLEL
jgi:hypothetical protein